MIKIYKNTANRGGKGFLFGYATDQGCEFNAFACLIMIFFFFENGFSQISFCVIFLQ